MKKKILAVFLSLCMAMSLLPVTALAAEGEGKISPPTASGNNFFANGTPITITADEPEGGADVTSQYTDFTATDTDSSAYISWNDNGTTKYVGVSDDVSIYGGGDGREKAVTLPSTSITMTGGTVWNLFGGNYGEETKDENFCSTVEGNVNISLSGKAVVKNLLHGAGARNTCVNGTITMTFDGVDLSNDTNKLYVNGGSWGNGNEGTRKIESGAMDTDAVANKVVINANKSKFYLLGGGGSGSTKVNNADVTLTDCEVDLLYLSGINGEVVDSSIVATGCTIGSFSATNRGFVGTGSVDLNNCTVTKLNTGAAEGCFSSDSGGTDGSGVTGRVSYDIDAASIVTEAVLTPYVMRLNNNYTSTIQNVKINKEGDPLKLSVASFDAVYNEAGTATTVLSEYLVPEDSILTLNNVETTIAKDNTLTNAGTINMDDDSSLTVASGATLKQAGTVNGTVDKEGTFIECVARVGNTGYETLEAALKAATNNQTVTLLKNAKLDADITISQKITIDGQGQFKIDAQPKDSHAITVASNAALTLKDVTLNITEKENQTGTYGLDVRYGATLTLNNAEIDVSGVSNATISASWGSTSAEPGKFILNNSKITATDIGGNFSNGGDWALTNSSIEIEDCASNGFSCNSATLDNSTVSVSGAQLMGVTAKEITLENDSAVTVKECGTDLPKDSKWATDDESYKHPVEIKKGGKVTIDSTSSMTLQNNVKGNNTVYFVESTLDNNGTLQANVVTKAPAGSFSVTVKNGSTVLDVATVESGTNYTLPAALSNYGYNHFVGWSDGTTTYDANTPVKIEKNTTFTAVWSYIPPANPNYRIDIPDFEGGTVTADPAAAKAGAEVTLTATPDEGYA
ncbi:MAG: InlB B-repeat-containing protein, partial [Evtepia sp.]|nr:InlB B-repeat-containing protein [Evtepia sp.]